MSEAISNLVGLAKSEGLSGKLTHWSQADAWWFDGQMQALLNEAGSADPALRFFETQATPHNRGDIGFKDDDNAIAVSSVTGSAQ